jgi:hypothetical protein
MSRTLCEWKKHEIVEDTEELAKIVCDPRFVCRKCARAAHKEKHLCKPIPLPAYEPEHASHGGEKWREE